MVFRRNPEHNRRAGRLQIVLAFSLLFLTGCVYLRLLEVKNQLKEFDKNFRVEVAGGFVLHFLDPVLYDKDLLYLSEVEPTRREESENRSVWTYTFVKDATPEEKAETENEIVITMGFNSRKKLTDVTLCEHVLKIVPADFLELTLRALGSAEVDKKNRRVRAESSETRRFAFHPPSRQAIVNGFGQPWKEETLPDSRVLTYHYRLVSRYKDEKEKKRGLAEMILYFDPQADTLARMSFRYGNMKISINYMKYKKQLDDTL